MNHITERESHHARLILDGLNDSEIACLTGCSLGNVRQIHHRLYQKLAIGSRLALLALTHREGIVW